jgi:hypothetical protein
MKRVYVDPTEFLERAARAEYASAEWHDLALLAHRLRREGPTGELVCLSALPPPVPPAAHQLSAAIAIVEKFGGRALLADDEALDPIGTAALVVREWLARGRGRVLVLAPEARVAPWADALAGLTEDPGSDIVLATHVSGLDLVARGWDALVVDAAHRFAGDDKALAILAGAPPRLLLVSSTPVRYAGSDASAVLALLGGPVPLSACVVRRTVPACVNYRLAEVVRLEGSAPERHLAQEARDSAVLAIAAGGPPAGAWSILLRAAEALPAALPRAAATVLDTERADLGRARVLSLLRTAQSAASRTPSKLEALIPLIGASSGRTLVAIESSEAAAWIRTVLAHRGMAVAPPGSHLVVPGERVRVIADGEPLKADPAAYSTLIHMDTPWDPRRLAARLARLAAAPELRIFHLALGGTVEDALLACYQDALALATPPGDVHGIVAELSERPEAFIRRSIVRGDFSTWQEALGAARGLACGAYLATAHALDTVDLSV